MRMTTALAAVVLTLGLGATADAGTTTNRIALNNIALNRIALNRIALNRIALNRIALNKLSLNKLAAKGVSSAVSAGESAVVDIVGIELPDGTSFTR
jgi:hypothetical protein